MQIVENYIENLVGFSWLGKDRSLFGPREYLTDLWLLPPLLSERAH